MTIKNEMKSYNKNKYNNNSFKKKRVLPFSNKNLNKNKTHKY